jgi:hypothetical protein
MNRRMIVSLHRDPTDQEAADTEEFSHCVCALRSPVGLVSIFDAVQIAGSNQAHPFHPPLHPFGTHYNDALFSDNFYSLIAFGVATMFGYASNLRAVYRIACFESGPIMARGVRQLDLENMFELCFPSQLWFHLRV